MVAAMDNQPGFGNSLDQIGQGYASPPAGSGQPGGQLRSFADIMRGPGDFRSRLQQFISQGQGNGQAGGGPQNSNYAGIFPGGAAGPPANPPATGDNQFGGAPTGIMPAAAGAPGGVASTPSQPPPNPPASGGPYGYGQPSGMMGNAFNAAGFGGLGAAMGGQGPGARYWARLNNIGGT